jgi:hypothetical protein
MKRSRRRHWVSPAYLLLEETYVVNQAQAAEMLGVSPRVLAAWRRRGEGPFHVRRGPYIRYSYWDLIRFLESQTGAATHNSED